MKAYKILLFIVAVIAMLAMLSAFYPSEGVQVTDGLTLRFPSLGEVLEGDVQEESEAPEDFLARREAEILQLRRDGYMRFFSSDSARFYLPGNDLSWFDSFFKALDSASAQRVRIVHYGDSQIEEDRVSKMIRAKLQKRFGGGGPGLIPLKGPYYSYSVSETVNKSLRQYSVFNPEGEKLGNKNYGPVGNATRVDSTIIASFTTPKKGELPLSTWFNRLTVLSGNGSLRLGVAKERQEVEAGKVLNFNTFNLPDSSSKVSLTLSGYNDIYGVMLDMDKGVSLDNVPMRGSGGTIFTSINKQQLKEFYEHENVKLIILQYGGNVVPYTKTGKAISNYKQSIEKQIKYLKDAAPDASILFIGPSDMSTSKNGKMLSYEHLPMLIDSLKAAANDNGAAYWDLYSAMGGENSMSRWVKAKPALAGSDYIHFTPRGADMMGEMFTNALMVYYEYYKWRKKNEE